MSNALAIRGEQRETSGLLAACAAQGYRVAIREARTPLQAPDFASTPLRRFVANVCTAAVIDRFETPDIAASYRLPHERFAGAALAWLSHLQTHDSQRRGPWECWTGFSRPRKAQWLRRRRELLHGLLKVVGEYQAARAALVEGGLQ